jgi:Tol biopolymer transport system component
MALRTLGIGTAALLLAGIGRPQVTERESVNSFGVQARFGAELPGTQGRVLSTDGRYIAFISASANLVPGDANGTWDVFLRDRLLGTTELISVSTIGVQANGVCGLFGLTMTADGRFVAFESGASSLVPGDTNLKRDVFLRDRLSGATDRVSVATGGTQGNGDSVLPSISADGRYVAFTSLASNLVSGDSNVAFDVFVRDQLVGLTERISVSTSGTQGDLDSDAPSISADGRWVAFRSDATNLVPGDTNGKGDVFLHDRRFHVTERISIATGGSQADQASWEPVISSDGQYIAFMTAATNVVAGDTNGDFDVFLHDRRNGTTERVSVATGGGQGLGGSTYPVISSDGRFVAFQSSAHNFGPVGTLGENIFVRDRLANTTELVSVSTSGAQPHYGGLCSATSISDDGRYVVFKSYNRDLVPGDSNAEGDVFFHDRDSAGFTSVCDPGTAGVIPCPCLNAPAAPGRGCDNSSATGGAFLWASGIAYLSMDSLVFTTNGEPPTAFSIVMQGNALLANGVVYGQGVRCVGGATKRLFTKTAVAGSITAPDFGAGDPTVSTRSAAKGDVIQPGQSRWYLVYYRDPNVLGGCPASSTFNATQTGQVSWWP